MDSKIEEQLSYEKEESYVEGKDVFYTTGELSKKFGNISRDMVRNRIDEFKEYLQIEYTPKGQMRIPSGEVEKIRTIINLRKERSLNEVKQILDDPDMSVMFFGSDKFKQELAKILAQNNALILQQFQQQLNLIEQKQNTNDKLHKELEEIRQQLHESRQESKEQTELIRRLLEEKEKKGLFEKIFRR